MTDATAGLEGFSQRDFRVGRALNTTFRVFTRHALSFFIIAGLVWVPTTILNITVIDLPPQEQAKWSLGAALFYLLLQPISTAIILYAAFQDMRGRPVRLGESAQHGLARVVPLIGLAILQVLGMFVGLLLLIVPGIILFVMWFVASPVCVVERAGPIQSLRRSRALTKGHRWKLFGIYLVLIITSFALSQGLVIGLATMMTPLIAVVGATVLQGVVQAFTSVFIVVIYHDLRVAKEGVDIEGIASVFD